MPDIVPPATLLDAIRAIVGDRGILTDRSDTAPYSEDWRRLYQGPHRRRYPAGHDRGARRRREALRAILGADRAARRQHLHGRGRRAE